MQTGPILIVEDDSRLGQSLEQGLRENGFAPARARSAREANQQLSASRFALVILDLGLPDADGLDLLARWRTEGVRTPVIITTARGRLSQRLQGLQTGADDYLVKPYALAELLARIQVQLRHAAHQQTAHRQQLADLEVDTLTRRVCRAGQPVELTPREFDLLLYLLAAQGQTVTREMLARDVWKLRAWTVTLDNVIDVHISRLRDKLDKNQPVRLLHTIRGIGFALRPQP